MTRRDYYAELGVARNATRDEVARAFRKLAAKYHPDRNPGDASAEERFKRVAEAYQVLSDPKARDAYDQGGEERVRADTGFHGFGSSEDVFSRFGDIFGDLFPASARGADLQVELPLTFEEAAEGGRKTFTITAPVECAACRGTGSEGGRANPCTACRGAGFVKRRARDQGAFISLSSPCPECGGSGRRPTSPCPACGGGGAVVRPRAIEVTIPPAVEDGTSLRLRGTGAPGTGGGEAGDILVKVRVARHPVFERDGLHLKTRAGIDLATALLGGRVRVPLLRGEAEVTIPPGTQPGQQFRLGGRGLSDGQGRRGDILLGVQVELPRTLTEEQKRLVREFAGRP